MRSIRPDRARHGDVDPAMSNTRAPDTLLIGGPDCEHCGWQTIQLQLFGPYRVHGTSLVIPRNDPSCFTICLLCCDVAGNA